MTERLSEVLREDVRLSVAGRTDAGVHAAGQVASFVTPSSVTPERMLKALNSALSPEVVVREAGYAAASFDARFSASGRVYRYVIRTSQVADPFSGRFEWHRPGEVSAPRMREAARAVVGEHDFSSFCRRPGAGKPTVRRVERATVRRDGELVVFGFRANAFLHQMVRSLVGTLVAVGEGRIEPSSMRSILAARDRSAAGHLAPARGLTFERVIYGKRDR